MKKPFAIIGILIIAMITACEPKQEADEHGCSITAGYTWCETEQRCIKQFEEFCKSTTPEQTPNEATINKTEPAEAQNNTIQLSSKDQDEHGCSITAGYTWCEEEQKCIKPQEEDCGVMPKERRATMSVAEVRRALTATECAFKGTFVSEPYYNNITQTWWVDMKMKKEYQKEGCNPACVIYDANKSAEINWRCTGLRTD